MYNECCGFECFGGEILYSANSCSKINKLILFTIKLEQDNYPILQGSLLIPVFLHYLYCLFQYFIFFLNNAFHCPRNFYIWYNTYSLKISSIRIHPSNPILLQ